MEELLHKLGIDWRLLIAQIVNFIILFVILRRVLYRPVLAMLRDRRERIAKGLADTETAARRLRDVELERRGVLQAADAERRILLESAAAEAGAVRAERTAAAEREATAVLARAHADAERTRRETLAAVRQEAAELIGSIAAKVTADRIPAAVHERIVEDATVELAKAKLA